MVKGYEAQFIFSYVPCHSYCSIPTAFHSVRHAALSFQAVGETFCAVNDSSLTFSIMQRHEWCSTFDKIPPLVILEFKKTSAA